MELIPVSKGKNAWLTKEDWKRSWKPWLRGTFIGFPIGTVPAGGADVSTFLSYAAERKLAKGANKASSARARSRASPDRKRPTTPRPPVSWCRC